MWLKNSCSVLSGLLYDFLRSRARSDLNEGWRQVISNDITRGLSVSSLAASVPFLFVLHGSAHMPRLYHSATESHLECQLFSVPQRLFQFKKVNPTGNLHSETPGDSEDAFLHCGDVLGLATSQVYKPSSFRQACYHATSMYPTICGCQSSKLSCEQIVTLQLYGPTEIHG